jgi:hypothetical protein
MVQIAGSFQGRCAMTIMKSAAWRQVAATYAARMFARPPTIQRFQILPPHQLRDPATHCS